MNYIKLKEAYPKAEIRDYVKMLYQKHMGPAHSVSSLADAITRLSKECSDLIRDGYIHIEFEHLSDEIYRMHFVRESDYKVSVDLAAKMFVESSQFEGNLEALTKELNSLNLVGDDQLFIEDYQEEVRAISHSESYKNAYNPRYRVVRAHYFKYIQLYSTIDLASKPIVINIDGNSGSGKSTLAHALSQLFMADVIHADDFFLQDHQRTEERLSEVGGNIDYERLKEEVIDSLKEGVNYRKFNCMNKQFSDLIHVNSQVIIIEGSYSSHPYFGDYSDLRVFLSIDKERQYQRILDRNGEKIFPRFKNEWIPKEDEYFAEFMILDKSDLTYFV